MSDDDSPKKKKQIRNSTAKFLIFSAQTGGDDLEVRYEDETIWLTQKLMAHLFGVDVRTVSEHLANIYDQTELQREATIRNFRIVQTEGTREVARQVDHYNLDAIISVDSSSARPEGTMKSLSPVIAFPQGRYSEQLCN